MSELITAADAADPFDYGILPAGVGVILGYVGQDGCTPNIWSAADVAAVHATGRKWAAIWTPPQSGFDGPAGAIAGHGMVAALTNYPGYGAGPVFLDIERYAYDSAPAAIMAGVATWQSVMHAAGHAWAVPYLPVPAGQGWQANWTGTPPQALPAGLDGVQYAGQVDGDRYDLSVFNASIFALAPTPPHPAPAPTPPRPALDPTLLPGGRYTVRPGDTLSGIAAAHGTTWQVLAALNHLANPNLIYPGQVLVLAGAAPSPGRYTVRPGDTLSGIAAAHGTTWQALAALNHLANPDLIYPGQVLTL